MYRRVAVLIAVLALVVAGGDAALAKKKIKVPTPGNYAGMSSDGITMDITVAKNHTGTFTYCEAQAFPFTITGRSFSVTYTDPTSGQPVVAAAGTFGKKSVSGSISLGGGCDGSPQTFALRTGH